MAQEDSKSKTLFFLLIGVFSFAGGLLGLGTIIIILQALGLMPFP